MVQLIQICKRFDEKTVLQNVSLDIPQGVTCLMGASGAGKTTLLRILLGLETPDSGAVKNLPDRVAVLFQEDRLVDTLTVRGNLKLALGRRYNEKAAARMLNALQLPDVLLQTVSTLSGGMKRRVALCRALLFDADLIVLDEPFKGLDEDTKAAVIRVVKAHAASRQVLLVTHDEEEAQALDARIVRL